MSWREQLKPASFKSIPFYTESIQLDFGRTIKIDKPGSASSGLSLKKETEAKEGAVIKDLGSREYEIMVKAYFLGEDYLDNRDAFEKAFIEGGTQVLILPLEAPMKVIPSRARRRWSSDSGGVEYIECSFYLATKEPRERIVIDTFYVVKEKAAAVEETTTENFVASYSQEGAAPFVEASALATAEEFSETLNASKGFGSPTDVFEDWVEKLDLFTLNLAEIIRTPERLVGDVMELVEGISTAYTTIESAINSTINLFETFEFSSLLPSFLSEDRKQENRNNNLLVASFKSASLSQMVQLSTRQLFASKDEALDRLNLLLGFIDDTIATAGEQTDLDFLHTPLSNLRASLVEDMTIRSAQLPSVLELGLPSSRSVLSIAYDLYGNLDREADLVERNKIQNPNASPSIMEAISP